MSNRQHVKSKKLSAAIVSYLKYKTYRAAAFTGSAFPIIY